MGLRNYRALGIGLGHLCLGGVVVVILHIEVMISSFVILVADDGIKKNVMMCARYHELL